MPRDNFSKEVVDTLARRVNYRCSMPTCRKGTSGPRTDPTRSVTIGVAAHITAAAAGGPRFDISLTPEQRGSAENGIHLCENHGKLVDNDTTRYTVDDLRRWKADAEAEALAELEGAPVVGPTSAAVLELLVGGVVIGGQRPPRPHSRGFDKSGQCNRHDYELVVRVRNAGSERLHGYHVELEFPAAVVEAPMTQSGYARDRSTRDMVFFRASGATAPELFPGDSHGAVTIRFYMDDRLFEEHLVVRASVKASLYVPGQRPLVVEHPFRALHNY